MQHTATIDRHTGNPGPYQSFYAKCPCGFRSGRTPYIEEAKRRRDQHNRDTRSTR